MINKLINGKLPKIIATKLRSRGLETMNKHFGEKEFIENFILSTIKEDKKFRILEIGFGEGKFIRDLNNKFSDRNLELYGINKGREESVGRQDNLLKKYNNINLEFYDVDNGLNFSDNFFDLVISQACIIYIEDKIKLFEEIARVLKVGGSAFLNIDGNLVYQNQKKYPKIMKQNFETPRLIIFKDNQIIKFSKYLESINYSGFDIKLIKSKRSSIGLVVYKRKNSKLNFNLCYNNNKSINLNTDLERSNVGITNFLAWNGFQSIYNINKK